MIIQVKPTSVVNVTPNPPSLTHLIDVKVTTALERILP